MIMKTKGFGFSILSTLSLSALTIVVFASVDDTEITHLASDPYYDSSDTLKKVKEALTT